MMQATEATFSELEFSANQEDIVGYTVIYSVRDPHVSVDSFNNRLASQGFATRISPISRQTALDRAIERFARTHFRVRRGSSQLSADPVVSIDRYHQGEEIVFAVSAKMVNEYGTVTHANTFRVALHKKGGHFGVFPENTGMHETVLFAGITQELAHTSDALIGRDIMTTLQEVLDTECHVVALRLAGAVYYASAQQVEKLTFFRNLVRSISKSSYCILQPVLKSALDSDMRAALLEGLENQVADVEQHIATMRARAGKGVKVRERSVAEALAQIQDLRIKIDVINYDVRLDTQTLGGMDARMKALAATLPSLLTI